MQVIFSRSLAARLEGTGVTSNSLEPGVVNTGLSKGITDDPEMQKRLENGVSVEEGAKTHIFLAASAKAGGESGGNWEDCEDLSKGLGKAKYIVAAPSLSQKMHDDLWKATEEFIYRVEHPDTPTDMTLARAAYQMHKAKNAEGERAGEPVAEHAEHGVMEPEPETEADA